MHQEIQEAIEYLLKYLYNKFPRRSINTFGAELEKYLKQKYAGHWYVENPLKGSAYRCLKSTDPLLKLACINSNLNYNDVMECMPQFSVWIDPYEVSYQIGENSGTNILWKSSQNQPQLLQQPITPPQYQMPPPQQQQQQQEQDPIANEYFYWNNYYNGSDENYLGQFQQQPQIQQHQLQPPQPIKTPNQKQLTTVAEFAMTKFGSTKLKSSGRNQKNYSNRHNMNPIEFSNYIKQKQLQQHAKNTAAMGSLQNQQQYFTNDYYFEPAIWSNIGQTIIAN